MSRSTRLLITPALLLCACSDPGNTPDDGGGTGGDLAAQSDGFMPMNDGMQPGGDMTQVAVGPDSFPATSPWYKDITSAGTASDSTTIINNLGGWGTLRIDVSFAIIHADANVARRSYTLNAGYYNPDCDHAPVPMAPGGAIENYPLNGYICGGGDCHLIVFQGTRLYELGVADVPAPGLYNGPGFNGGCLAIWDLTKDYWAPGTTPYSRGDQCTSSDAAGFPIAPLLLTAADLAAPEIQHALRFTLSNSLIRANSYVHPATHGTGPSGGGASGGSNTMPYGSRLRLKPGTYTGNAQAQKIYKALQKYGMFMADGGDLYISGTADLIGVVGATAVSSLNASNFEIIDQGAPLVWNGNCTRTPLTN